MRVMAALQNHPCKICIFFHQLKKTLEHRKGKGARLHDRIGIEDSALVKLYSGAETLESGLGDLSDGMTLSMTVSAIWMTEPQSWYPASGN